jgi:MFS family permease
VLFFTVNHISITRIATSDCAYQATDFKPDLGLDTTVAAAVQTPIYEQFGEVENLAWVGIGFPMASVAVILLLGRLYDLVDIKILILVSTALFEGGSALCGGAPNMSAMIVGRVIAGIGGAGMYLGCVPALLLFG